MSNICKECCAELPEGAAACPECGAPVSAPATSAEPAASRPEPTPFPSAVPAPQNAGGSAKKVFASQVSETNSTDNSSHVQDNSSNVTTTIINQGRVEQEYCDVCGNALEKGHAKCPKCGKKICPSCKAKGKNRCTDCDRRAKDEYRLEFRGTLLEMDGKLNAFGRRHMDEIARKLDISPTEKEEIEKEFASSAASGAGTRIGGVKATSAPEIVSAFASVRVPSAAEKPAAPASNTVSQKGLGSLRGGASRAYVPQGVAVPPRNPPPPPAPAGNAASSRGVSAAPQGAPAVAQSTSAGTTDKPGAKAPFLTFKRILFGGIFTLGAIFSVTFKLNSCSMIAHIETPPPEAFRVAPTYMHDYTKFDDDAGIALWAQEKMPEKYKALEKLEKDARDAEGEMVGVATSVGEGYQAEAEFKNAKRELDQLEFSAKALRSEIRDAYNRWNGRVPVPETYHVADYTVFDDGKIAGWAKKKMATDYEALKKSEAEACAANKKMIALAKRLESDPATWGTYAKNADFVMEKAKLEKAEESAKALHEKIRIAYENRPKTKPYALARGDTPTKICEKHGITMEELQALNPGVEFSVLKMKAGQVISVPATDED